MRQPKWVVVVVALAVALALGAGSATAATDKREVQARAAFAAGRYQEALDVFVKLYAETVHPNYLRNIGRCYQNLGEPDKAISSFREYLRQAKSVRPDERQEVEGYIKEMEDLKQQRAAAAAPPPPPPPPPPTTTTGTTANGAGASDNDRGSSPGLPSARNPGPAEQTSAVLVETPRSGSGPAQAEESKPVYTRWWFWALIGGAIVGGVAVAAATGAFTKTQDATCPGGGCQ